MKNNTNPANKYLNNHEFILWCITSGDESEEWYQKELQLNPENKETIQQAIDIMNSLKMNNKKLPQELSDSLQERIKGSLKQKRLKRRKYIYIGIAAACLFLSIIFLPTIEFTSDKSPIAENIEEEIIIEQDSKEIELIIANREKIVLENKTTLKQDATGSIKIVDEKGESDSQTIQTNDSISEEEYEEILLKVPYGRHTSLQLSDGTRIWVNSGSVLKFPSQFEADNRTIHVVGEAYMEVTHDSERPFYVHTDKMRVEVLGTSFNVCAYEDDLFQSVVLVEGSVDIKNNYGESRKIKPNEMYYMTENAISVSRVPVYDYISWKDGVYNFDRKSLEYVARCLSRYYSVDITYSDQIKNISCSGKLVLFDDITSVLKTLQKSVSITYEIDGESIKISTNP